MCTFLVKQRQNTATYGILKFLKRKRFILLKKKNPHMLLSLKKCWTVLFATFKFCQNLHIWKPQCALFNIAIHKILEDSIYSNIFINYWAISLVSIGSKLLRNMTLLRLRDTVDKVWKEGQSGLEKVEDVSTKFSHLG